MKKKIFLLTISLIFIFSISIVSASGDTNQTDIGISDNDIIANENNIYVNVSNLENGDGSIDNPYNNFGSAAGNASNGSVIYLSSGVYSGKGVNVNLTIDKSLNLVNWDNGDVIFDGLNQSNIFNVTSPVFNVSNIIFRNANAGYGSALYFANGLKDSNINATFLNNRAEVNGAAIFINGENTNNVFNGYYFNNVAHDGGAIYIDGESNNNVFNATFNKNNALINGGALYFNNVSCNDIFCGRYIGNTVNVTSGGSIYFFSETRKNIFNGDFIKSYSPYFGGIMFDASSYGNVFSGNFINNSAFYDGAAICASWNIENCVFSGNFINNYVHEFDGSSICLVGDSHNNIFNGYYANNYAAEGGVVSFGGSINDTVTGTFINNSAHAFGGVLLFCDIVDHLYVNATFINNSIERSGAAITFYRNFANNVTNSIIAGDFINNTADVYGGAIYFYALRSENNTISANFINNTSPKGSGIYFRCEEIINTTFINSNFISNKADSSSIDYCIDDNNLLVNASLKAFHNYINAIYSINDKQLHFVNVSYWGENGIIHSGDVTFNASDLEVGQNLTLEIYGGGKCILNITNVTNNDGYASFDYSTLDYGNYTCLLYHCDDNYYTAISREFNLTINPFVVEVENLVKYYSAPDKLLVNLTDREGRAIANQSVIFNINGRNYTRTSDENGSAALAINLNSGEYPCVVYVNDTAFNVNVTVLTTVNGTDITKVYRNATQYYATFLDSEGSYLKNGTAVRFNINGVMYDREISGDEGLAKLNINLAQGEYIITAMNLETGESASNNITVIPRIIENENITKYFRNGTQYSVKVIGDDGNPVGAGEVVKFNINGVFYERTTNESGIAKLNINLNPGDYIITAEYNGSAVSNNIKVLPILTADDLDKKYADYTPFEAKLVDGEGNPYSNQTVGFNINGVLYNRTTDGDGIAKLNINLQAGEYIITSTYDYAVISNKITVRN